MRPAARELPETEKQAIEHWRYDVLIKAGYDPVPAERLALCAHVDLREAVQLLRRGCKQVTALEILL